MTLGTNSESRQGGEHRRLSSRSCAEEIPKGDLDNFSNIFVLVHLCIDLRQPLATETFPLIDPPHTCSVMNLTSNGFRFRNSGHNKTANSTSHQGT